MIPHNKVCLREEDEVLLAGVLQSGQIGQGPQVRAFEAELAERFRPGGEAVCVASGTAALRLAYIALGFEEIAIPSYACVSLYHAINDGASIIGVMDCDPLTFNTPGASVVVHTYGLPSPVPDSAIEDFTHAPGAELFGRPCGSFGRASVISFGATKPLGLGGGGAVLGPPDLIAEIRDMRDYDGKREFKARFNWQMSDILAALGRHRLERLDEENDQRRYIAERYASLCEDRFLHIQGRGTTWFDDGATWYRFVARVPDPKAAIDHFAKHDIGVINPLEPWELIHRQVGLDASEFPSAENVASSTISLPIWPGMLEPEITRVVAALGSLRV